MKDFKNLSVWLLIHLLHWAVLYGAFVAQSQGAMHVLKFFVWVLALSSLTLLMEASIKATAKHKPKPVRGHFSILQSWVTLLLLMWFGHFASAGAWAVVMLMLYFHREAVRSLRAANAA